MTTDEFLYAAYCLACASWPGCRPAEVHIVMEDGTVKRFALPDFATLAFLAQHSEQGQRQTPASGSPAERQRGRRP